MTRVGWGALGLVALSVGIGLAAMASAGPLSIVAGACLGIGFCALLPAIRSAPVPEAPVPVVEEKPAQPRVEDLLGAVDDPLLLVEGGLVLRANAAALATLGDHVVGEDIRVAVRHPAAASLLARAEGGRTELVGLGSPDRLWTLAVMPLGRTTKLVRLADHSAGRAAERMRVDFVANASHELRTPLASLIGFIETLEDANGPDEAPIRLRFLAIMAGEARRMQRLVDDLISLSRIEADKHLAPQDAVSIGALARETADTVRGDRRGPARVQLSIEEGLPPVAGDRAQLSQLLHNLVGNAIKYGDATKPVQLRVTRDSVAMIRLAVADEGEGISPQHLPRLTERFYRVDPGRSRAGGGTGLGLAIVKHIVERHRGRLDIASTQGVGTTVTVLLPIAEQAAAAAAAAE